MAKAGGGQRNEFGLAFAAAGKEWTVELCNEDTDGDGITNGDHLGDPLCIWKQGATPSRTVDITHPGPTEGSSGSAAPAWVIAHGVLMILAWCLLLPIGIMCSVFRSAFPEDGQWFKNHQSIQGAGLLLVVAAFVVAVVMLPDGSGHFSNSNVAHKIIGLVVVIIAVLQPLNAACRPHPAEGGEAKSGKRLAWELLHKNAGRIGALLAIANCILGALAVTNGTGSAAAIFAWVVLGVCLLVTVVVAVVLMSKAKRAKE